MQGEINRIIEMWKSDYGFKTFASSAISALIGIIFTIYNGVLGICYHSVWNISICVYYCCLALVRMLIIRSQRRKKNKPENEKNGKDLHFATHTVFFLLNFVLIAPIAYMINDKRSYSFGLIPAIGMAVYTVYRIVMVVINTKKSYKHENILVRELRMLNIVDTAVAVLTLQNTLIVAGKGSVSGSMRVLSIISSCVIWAFTVAVSIFSFKNRKSENKS